MLKLSHKNLEVYQLSLILVKLVSALTDRLPKKEIFVLSSQIRRAALSVTSNIAEGASRTTGKEKSRFFEIARASLVEVDAQLEVCVILNYDIGEMSELESAIVSIFKLLTKMINNLRIQTSH